MRTRRFIPSRRSGDKNTQPTTAARSTKVVLKRQAERAETYEPGEHPVHVATAELLTSARTGSVSVKLTASHLEDGKPVALTPLLIEGRAENLAAENLHRLSELARLNGHDLDAEPDENGDTAYDTDELIRSVSGAKVWVQLGARFDEYSRRSVNTLDEVIEPVSAEDLAALTTTRAASSD
jgi:hypothetical protein